MYKLKIINNCINTDIKIYINNQLITSYDVNVDDMFSIRVETNNLFDNDEKYNSFIKEQVKSIIINGRAETNEDFTPLSGYVEADIMLSKDTELVIDILKDLSTIILDIKSDDAVITNKKIVSDKKNKKRYLPVVLFYYIPFAILIGIMLVLYITTLINNEDLETRIIFTTFISVMIVGLFIASYILFKPLLTKKKIIDKNAIEAIEKKNKRLYKVVYLTNLIYIIVSIIGIIVIFNGIVSGIMISAGGFIVRSVITTNIKDISNIKSKKLNIAAIIMFVISLLSIVIIGSQNWYIKIYLLLEKQIICVIL